jgi:hypothetical protein
MDDMKTWSGCSGARRKEDDALRLISESFWFSGLSDTWTACIKRGDVTSRGGNGMCAGGEGDWERPMITGALSPGDTDE